ncbi:MAG: hypothetical protein U0Q18_36735 [Bryobacteraceae bacterium]
MDKAMVDMRWRVAALIAGVFWLIGLTVVPAWAGSPIVYVPSPNGTDDTTNIQSALDMCVQQHPKGCTVQLGAGTYLTRALVAYNFHGTFKGRSTSATIIEAIYPLLVTVPDFYYGVCKPNTTSCIWPSLIMFVDGDIHISDLSIHIVAPPGSATTGWYAQGTKLTDLIDAIRVMGQYPTNATVDRIDVEARPDNSPTSFGFNLINGVCFPGELPRSPSPYDYYRLSGSFVVRNSSFRSMNDGVAWGNVTASHFSVGGSPSTGNSFDNLNVGVDMESAEQSQIEVSFNQSTGIYYSAWVVPWISSVFIPSAPSRYSIHDNDFRTTGAYATGILVYNEPGHPWINAAIWNNSVQLQGTLSDGIDAVNTQLTTIVNNKISGTGYDGIGLWSSTWSTAIGNNLKGFGPDATVGLAQIYLDSYTSENLVMCSNPSDTVLNQGLNNATIGCHQIGSTPQAETARAAPEPSVPDRGVFRKRPSGFWP